MNAYCDPPEQAPRSRNDKAGVSEGHVGIKRNLSMKRASVTPHASKRKMTSKATADTANDVMFVRDLLREAASIQGAEPGTEPRPRHGDRTG